MTKNRKNQIIVMEDGNALVSKAFAKQARIFGTPEYKLWREFLKDNTGAQMVFKTNKINTQRDTYKKNKTYEKMLKYIRVKPNAKENEIEFERVKIESKMQVCPYKYVEAWFDAKFPKYKTHEIFADDNNAENNNANDSYEAELKVVNE